MKTRTEEYKNQVKLLGRELDSKITYQLEGQTIELGSEDLNSVTPSFQADILKSCMKQLDIDSNVEIPLETVLNYKFGVKVNDTYEYIDFGNYVVYEVEKQEDTNSYKITCFDKILYSMKDYEKMDITYPISVRDYLNAICNHLGITFGSINSVFANYNKMIQTELYLDASGGSIGYTFRDVLDELAQVTASTICINKDDALEVRYIHNTGDTIDEEYLKNINVNFGEKYGPINSIVLSRSAESDNVYLQNETSIAENGLCEIKIKDNQIMNFNDRSSYLQDILARLNGLEYYLNDFASTGITYYDVCDRYNVQIGEETYSCVMFNDEILVTQGLEENIHTDLPIQTETDYSKSDKTDMRINQTYLIVDKQNQQIQSAITKVGEQDEKISQITQTVDELNSKISDIADITTSGESQFGWFELDDVNQSEPIMVRVRPINKSIRYIYPRDKLYPTTQYYPKTDGLKPSNSLTPSNTLVPRTGFDEQDIIYPKLRLLRFENKTTGENFDYELPDDLLYYDENNYDEFYLSYESNTCEITKRCYLDENGKVQKLSSIKIDSYPYPTIALTDGNYKISLIGYDVGYLFVRLMASNIYTSQYATRVELHSTINQTARDITTEVSETYARKNEIDSISTQIKQTARSISLTATDNGTSAGITIRLRNEEGQEIDSESANITMNGKVAFTDLQNPNDRTIINGSNIKTGTIDANVVNVANVVAKSVAAENITGTTISGKTISGGYITGTTISGNTISGGTITGTTISGSTISGNTISGGTITGSTINTTQDLYVGNQIRVGSNQSNSSSINKYLRLTSDAYLRRQLTSSGANQLEVHSNGAVQLSAGSYYFAVGSGGAALSNATRPGSWSDKRLKNKIKDINVDWIKDLQIKEFEYKIKKDQKQIGLIAQDYIDKDYSKYFLTKEIDPQNDKEYYSICYQNITNALIKYCQELEKRIEKLERESDK